MTTDPRTGITLLSTQQRYKEQLINEGFAHLGAIATGAVVSLTQTSPPTDADLGEVYFVPNGATGIWAGHGNKLALKIEGGWSYFSIPLFQRIYSLEPEGLFSWSGTDWIAIVSDGDMRKSVYDTNNDGVVDAAEVANSVDWEDVQNKPSVGGGGRETLTANRTYYVSTTGNDSNNGLTTSTAFRNIQKAVDVVASLDMSVYNVVIQLGDGTYNESITLKQCLGSGSVTLQGNTTNRDNVVIVRTATSFCFRVGSVVTTKYNLKFLRLNASSGGSCIDLSAPCVVEIGEISLGNASDTGAILGNQAVLLVENTVSFFGTNQYGIACYDESMMRTTASQTLNILNCNLVSGLVVADRGGSQLWVNTVFTGTPTGNSFVTNHGRVIRVNAPIPGTISVNSSSFGLLA